MDKIILRIGSQGTEVIWLQRQLGIKADGYFGPKTEAAVLAFQQENDLAKDGIVGPTTLAKMGFKSADPTWIAIHVSASPAGDPRFNAAWIKNYHTKILGWDKMGYNYVIEEDGTLVETHPVDLSDGLQKSETTYGIGGWRDAAAVNICLVGGLTPQGTPSDTRTPAQEESLQTLVLCQDYILGYIIQICLYCFVTKKIT